MTALIEALKKETQSLMAQYLEMTEKWAESEFLIYKERCQWKTEQWASYLGVETKTTNDFYQKQPTVTFGPNFYNTAASKTYHNQKTKARSVVILGLEMFKKKQLDHAIRHYDLSLLKLAQRIEKMKLDITHLKITNHHVGVNIELVITDGSKSIKAWTIIAGGVIQKPHYRYLVR